MAEIGDALRERRMAVKVDVHEVEEATKIRAKYLRALENEEYNLLPGPAYVKSFLRTYADYLGLDSRQLVDIYKLRHEHATEDHAPFAPRPEVQSSSSGRRRLIFAIAVIVLIILVLFILGQTGGSGSGPS
jgi:cytoskeletal protein RodZ